MCITQHTHSYYKQPHYGQPIEFVSINAQMLGSIYNAGSKYRPFSLFGLGD